MKKLLLPLSLLLSLLIAGCGTFHNTTGSINGNDTNVVGGVSTQIGESGPIIAVNGTINPQNPDEWSAGISITFRTAPSKDVLQALAAANARVSDHSRLVYFIPDDGSPVRGDSAINDALESAASQHGVVIKRL